MQMRKDQQAKIRAYLSRPANHPRPQRDEELHFVYLITYLGELFIQGYRIIEQFDDVLILSLMQFQISESLSLPSKRILRKIPPKYKALLWLYDDNGICESGAIRRSIYSNLLQSTLFFSDIEYNIIYLHTCKFSILRKVELQKNSLPSCKNYFKKIQWIEQKNGLRPLHEKQQGIQLHKLVQIFIKGAGQARTNNIIQKMQIKNKFYYDLFNVIHTICYVIGKQMFENDYQTISSQKWMRFTTQKRFKRYDLLLRNQNKSSILDWKFSKLMAQDKIKGNGVKNKNKIYYQLAYKDFLTDVELKYYCFHSSINMTTYHHFTCAAYYHKIPIENIQIMDDIINLSDQDLSIHIQQEMLQRIHNNLNQNQILQPIIITAQPLPNIPQSMHPSFPKNTYEIISLEQDDSDSTNKQKKINSEIESWKNMKKSLIKQKKYSQKFIDLTLD